jgi:hypothetical protein
VRRGDDPELHLLHGRFAHLIFDFETAREQLETAHAAFVSSGV